MNSFRICGRERLTKHDIKAENVKEKADEFYYRKKK